MSAALALFMARLTGHDLVCTADISLHSANSVDNTKVLHSVSSRILAA